MNVVKPPKSLAGSIKNQISIFLAGSIEGGDAEQWQEKVERYFTNKHQYTLYNPRREEWNSSWKQEYENPQFYQQVNWELNALDKADVIIMYLSPKTKSPISLLELGLYASSGKLVVCCPEGFWRRGNVEVVCEKYGIPFYNNLTELLLRYS